MDIEKVQQWVQSVLLLTVAFIFAGGMALLSDSAPAAGARPGLLVLAAITGVLGVAGARLIHHRSALTPWLLTGILPAVVGWWVTR